MKFFVITILLTLFYDRVKSSAINPIDHGAQNIPQLVQLNELITKVKTRDVELPFPIDIVDSFEFDILHVNLPGEIFSINANVSKGKVSGLSSVRFLDLSISPTEPIIGFDVLFPSLAFHSDHYELEGNIYYAVPLKGKGVAHLEIQNLELSGTIYLGQSDDGNSIIFEKLENADYHVERIVSTTEFDQNIDSLISAMVEDLLADYLNRFSKYICSTYSDILIQYINDIVLIMESHQNGL